MAEEKKTFSLAPVEGKDKTYSLADYENLKNQCAEFIKKNSLFIEVEIPADLKACREERKLLNERLKAIQNARLQVNGYYMGEFNRQCKELETMLKQASDAHSESIHKVEEAMGKGSTKAVKLEIRTYDESVADKIEKYAISLGAEVKRS